MNDEEDDEVLLEGGQLHQYLKEAVQEHCLVYKNGNMKMTCNEYEFVRNNPSSTVISPETKEQISIILNSSLMLEEDAYALYLFSQNVTLRYERLNFKTLLSCASTIFTGCAGLLFKKKRSKIVPFCLLSAFCMINYGRKLLAYRCLNTNVSNLCSELNVGLTTLRSTYSILKEDEKCIKSKEICNKLKHPEAVELDRYNWARQDVNASFFSLAHSLLDLWTFSKRNTINLLDLMKEVPCSVHIASKTDSELGLDEILKEYGSGEINPTKLEVLYHLNLMLQSEFLRILGFVLSKINSPDKRYDVAHLLQTFTEFMKLFSEKQLNLLQYYNRWKHPEEMASSKKVVKETETTNKEIYIRNAVHSLRSSVYSLFIEISGVEDILSKNNLSLEETFKLVGLGLDNITGDLEEIWFQMEKIPKMLSRKVDYPNLVITTEAEDTVTTAEAVGKSDFSIRSPDEVFVGIPRGSDHNNDDGCTFDICDDAPIPDKRTHACYDKVISEIKVAIQSKKVEFEERELIALKKNPDYEAYLQYQEKEEEKERFKKNISVEGDDSTSEGTGSDNEVLQENFHFHKVVAQLAAKKSEGWKADPTEDQNQTYEG